MSKEIVTRFIDDRTGKEVAEAEAITVILTRKIIRPDGVETTDAWELILAEPSEKELGKTLEPFTKTAAPTGPHRIPSLRTRNATDPMTPVIREWWEGLTRTQLARLGETYNDGEPLPEAAAKGRIPESVRKAYLNEHPPA